MIFDRSVTLEYQLHMRREPDSTISYFSVRGTDSVLMVNPESIFNEWLNEQLRWIPKLISTPHRITSMLLLIIHWKLLILNLQYPSKVQKSQPCTCVRRACKSLMKRYLEMWKKMLSSLAGDLHIWSDKHLSPSPVHLTLFVVI